MADVRYFNDDTQLQGLHEIKQAEFDVLFPGSKAIRWSYGYRLVGMPVGVDRAYDHANKRWSPEGLLPAERCVTYKSRPSRHVCDARCMGATGKTMNCECSCGGKNHGRGFIRECAEV